MSWARRPAADLQIINLSDSYKGLRPERGVLLEHPHADDARLLGYAIAPDPEHRLYQSDWHSARFTASGR
jgi:hypothetical protein